MIIILCGVSLCGKSTWAKKQGKWIVSRDSEREALFGEYRMGSREEESAITNIIWDKIDFLVGLGDDVIVDNTSLRRDYIEDFVEIAEEHNVTYEVLKFPLLEREELIKRNSDRYEKTGKFIPKEVLDRQIKAYNELDLDGLNVTELEEK